MLKDKNIFHIKHPTHFESAYKFIGLICVVFGYFFYLSYEYDTSTGLGVLALTWSFFVLCTPIADAGFLVDFPIRLLFGVRMIMVEIFVWLLAIAIVLLSLYISPELYKMTAITSIFYQILTTPIPYWSIIILCCIGTFGSIYFGDEMLDVISHADRKAFHKHGFKHRTLILITVVSMVICIYYQLINQFGLTIVQ